VVNTALQMNIKSLIGKEILDIRSKTSGFEYEGSIPLQQSQSQILLYSGEVFELPYHGTTKIYTEEKPIYEKHSILKIQPLNRIHSFLLKKFPHFFSLQISELEALIIGRKIMNVYQIEEEDSFLNKVIIELDNGTLFTERDLSPMGIGAGIMIFETKEKFDKQYNETLIEIL
jgi:hypothetical protein